MLRVVDGLARRGRPLLLHDSVSRCTKSGTAFTPRKDILRPFHDEMEYALVVPLEYRCVCCALYTRQACFLETVAQGSR